jgi:hypothetical protein
MLSQGITAGKPTLDLGFTKAVGVRPRMSTGLTSGSRARYPENLESSAILLTVGLRGPIPMAMRDSDLAAAAKRNGAGDFYLRPNRVIS